MEENKSILYELYVYSEWKPEPEYIQKPDSLLPENISALWRWIKFFGPKKSLIDSITAYKERQQKWHIALGDEGKVLAVLTDNILEIRTKRSEYGTIAARTTVARDAYPQWRKVVWSPDCSFVAVAYGNGVVSFFDLTASNLFNIPTDCSRPGGLECTDNTHAVADIIFMPLRVKDNKWNWEVLIVTYDGKLRGYLVSQTDGFKLHHTFSFAGGVAALAHSAARSLLYVAGLPRPGCKDPASPLSAGVSAWRIVNDEPFYALSVASQQLESELNTDRLHLYLPLLSAKNLSFITSMKISPDGSKLACVHCTGEVSSWRLPLLKLIRRFPISEQPDHDLKNPLMEDDDKGKKDPYLYYPCDIDWWSNEEVILSRFSGVVSVCSAGSLQSALCGGGARLAGGAGGGPRVEAAPAHALAVALECATTPARQTELVKSEPEVEDTMFELTKELFKSVLYSITDMESFQPRPRRVAVVSRVYRLLAIKSTTPEQLFSTKIETGQYSEALKLAAEYHLDSDRVYQHQWRKTPVSTDAIHKYLSKVSKRIWSVHQCVDRLPESLAAAHELLQFGLQLSQREIMDEINKDRPAEARVESPEHITVADLNAYSSEVLRCRHVMLFYTQRLQLYEAILCCEKSTYVKEEYERLRSNSLVHSATELAKEGRIAALTCLSPHLNSIEMQLAVLEKIPETMNPLEYKHLLPSLACDREERPQVKCEQDRDWCRKEIFRSIWNSNWSEDSSPDGETPSKGETTDIAKWYEKRAREIEEYSGLVSHALTLLSLALQDVDEEVKSLNKIVFHLKTLDILLYDVGIEDVTLKELEKMDVFETCHLLIKMSGPETFVSDVKALVVPYLKRYEALSGECCQSCLIRFMERLSVHDLSHILLILSSGSDFELDVRTRLELAERCLMAHVETDQLDKACDIVGTVLKESDGSISPRELVRRACSLERAVWCAGVVWRRGVRAALAALRRPPDAARLLHATAHSLDASLQSDDKTDPKPKKPRKRGSRDDKLAQQEWEKLLKDLLELQSTMYTSVPKEKCYEFYASALLRSSDPLVIKLASEVLTCDETDGRRGNGHFVPYDMSVTLVTNAAREYFNSSSSLTDPALEMARCCLLLIEDGNPEIQEELDLISALHLLNEFNLTLLPIQVRLCEDRMTLIEDCLQADKNAYLASHKLLKLAKLLRVAQDDEQKREGQVLQQVCARALRAGAGAGGGAAAAAARRLCALRHAPAAHLMADVAAVAQAHADRNTRRELFAAAVTYCDDHAIEHILRSRLALELENLQQNMWNMREQAQLAAWHSTEDEFADAVTTPVIEKKDLVPPTSDKKTFFTNMIESLKNKYTMSEKPAESQVPNAIHMEQFYQRLYPEHLASPHYDYSAFSVSSAPQQLAPLANGFYIQHTIDNCDNAHAEDQVLQYLSEEVLYTDTALAVCCSLRACRWTGARARDAVHAAALLYAATLHCTALHSHHYRAAPAQLARTTLQENNASTEQMELIKACLDKLHGSATVQRLRRLGYSVNGPLFHADEQYRAQVLYNMAISPKIEHVELALSLAEKYNSDQMELVCAHARAVIGSSSAALAPAALLLAAGDPATTIAGLNEKVFVEIPGTDHNALINYFTVLKSIDEKATYGNLTPAEHIKLLKKAKACAELDYKLLLSAPPAAELEAHLLAAMRPEGAGLLVKLLRSLPPPLKLPINVNDLYTAWLTKYFFSVPPGAASSKRWMQQYRQCAGYFSKLAPPALLALLTNTCFSAEAVQRVGAGTRSLMLQQAADYCQQEHDSDLRTANTEMSWASLGQELTRWARFLDNFHSSAIQGIVEGMPAGSASQDIWLEIEKSHGALEDLMPALCRLVLEGEVRASSLASLLQCLHVPCEIQDIFQHILNGIDSMTAMETLVTRVTQYHKENIKFSDDFLESVTQKATELGLPPYKLISLLSLGEGREMAGDVEKAVRCSVELLREEWRGEEFVDQIDEQSLLDESSRRDIVQKLLSSNSSWRRQRALADALCCLPRARADGERSIQCEYIAWALNRSERGEGAALVKLMLRRPLLDEQELSWLTENTPGESVVNLLWVLLLSKNQHSIDGIPALLVKHKVHVEKSEIDDEIIKELLENGLLTKLVSTPIYPFILNYVLSRESQESYDAQWTISELLKANYYAEAGHLQLLSAGVPAPLRGFTQSVLYYKNMFTKK